MKSFKAIVATLGLSLLLAGAAVGQDRRGHDNRGGGDRGGHSERGRETPAPRSYERGAYDRGAYPRERAPMIGVPVGRPLADRSCGDFVACRANRPEYPGYAPGSAPYPRGGWRRGEFLPRDYWGGSVLDPHRYHLRSPPPGYGWYGIGPDAYLVQRSTGLILDTAPGGR